MNPAFCRGSFSRREKNGSVVFLFQTWEAVEIWPGLMQTLSFVAFHQISGWYIILSNSQLTCLSSQTPKNGCVFEIWHPISVCQLSFSTIWGRVHLFFFRILNAPKFTQFIPHPATHWVNTVEMRSDSLKSWRLGCRVLASFQWIGKMMINQWKLLC